MDRTLASRASPQASIPAADATGMKTRWLRILLIVAFAAVALGVGYHRYGPDDRAAGSRYPAAESLAGPMSDEWREFAASVDQACARNYNAMQVELTSATGASDAWEIQYLNQSQTYREVAALGEPS